MVKHIGDRFPEVSLEHINGGTISYQELTASNTLFIFLRHLG